MGGGSWSTSSYASAAETRAATGVPDFEYDDKVRTGRASGIHPDLDPRKVAGPKSPFAGQNVRESRDLDGEHPESRPIVAIFDDTGSMREIPRVLQKKLANLMDVVIAKAGVKDPQVLVGAIGDATSDSYPFQIGQFESDNRFDEQLRNLILEGGGGPYGCESYDLVFYAAARKFKLDSVEKRGQKGFLFLLADEQPRRVVSARQVSDVFGDQIEKDIPLEDIIAEAKELFEIYLIMPSQLGTPSENRKVWEKYLDAQHVVSLDDADLVCELIAGLIYMLEGERDLDKVVTEVGLTGAAARTVKNALVPVATGRAPAHVAKGSVKKAGSGKSGVSRV